MICSQWRAHMHAGWDLMNEPRSAKSSGIQDIQSWITEVAPFVKTLANHQLVTVGEDGFYGPTTCQAWNGCALPLFATWNTPDICECF